MLVAYGIGAGVQTGWLVVDGDPEFFATTKRIHNRLHGSPGDGGELGSTQRNHYQSVLETNLPKMLEVIRPGDVVILHDPQTVGLTHALVGYGAHVIWRCHVGSDITNAHTDEAWSFLRPYCESAQGLVFSRRQYAPDWVNPERLEVIAPAIDPFSLKNVDMEGDVVTAVLARVGILAHEGGSEEPTFRRGDGTTATVRNLAEVLREGEPLSAEMPLVVQVSRWDRLKDMAGVLSAFAMHVVPAFGAEDVHLVLVGPSVAGVTDDPEGQQVLSECTVLWKSLPREQRRRVSLVSLPTQDIEENAVIVNAIQRHASIVVQKSLVEGFGLTVAEALWKSRPMVASAVGGILDQITNEEQGLLIADPADLAAFGAALTRLLQNPAEAARLGAAGRRRVIERFLPDRDLRQWAQLISRVDVD
jgi:trehalose synthase